MNNKMMVRAGNGADPLLKTFSLLDEIFSDSGLVDWEENAFYPNANMPPMDLYIDPETKDMTFEFALAGYSKEDIGIDFNGDFLELCVSKKNEEKDRKAKRVRKGISFTEIKNKYTVPSSKYKQDESKASFEDGILKIEIPARESEQKRSITIK